MAHLLVVDDEPAARSTFALLLRKRGHRVLEAEGVTAATKRLAEEVFDLVVTDLRMPDGDGLDVLRAVKAHAPATEVILLTAYAEWKSAKEAIRLGALDYFEKGQEPDELNHRIDKALAGATAAPREREPARPAPRALRPARPDRAVPGHADASSTWSRAWRRPTPPCSSRASPAPARRSSPRPSITPARGPRARSWPSTAARCPRRCSSPSSSATCAGRSPGATVNKLGLFEEADGGTLFLDEIAEMPAALQVKLLRALQSGEIRRLGATQAATIDVRVIAATHGDLAALISQGSFREDLFYRLNVIQVALPPAARPPRGSARAGRALSRARGGQARSRAAASRRRPSSACCATPGPATSASWRTPSSAPPSWPAAPSSSPTICRPTSPPACSSAPHPRCRARSRWPTPSASTSSRRSNASAATTPAPPKRSASAARRSGGS